MKSAFFKRLKERWLYILYGHLGKWILTCIGHTLRFHIEGSELYAERAGRNKCILMFWHNRLMLAAEILKRTAPGIKYAALISNSRDGELIAVLVNSYKRGRTIRVPHDARSMALKNLIREIQNQDDVIIVTPDGPRGPAFQVKPGIVLAAAKTSAEVFPLTWSSSGYWKLPTWDGLMLPKPFSKVSVKFGPPVKLSDEAGHNLSEGKELLEKALLSLEMGSFC